ncbi:M48 family metallopeptidase [Aquisphaera insulae]|uniref:M48 family metallopeptidase n=1 Tax=Aquisphaera insulae TaxID=2712864 RepID=UPI00202F4EF2|nr:M48 family metallopeptidase [Aquisphaera insulae]
MNMDVTVVRRVVLGALTIFLVVPAIALAVQPAASPEARPGPSASSPAVDERTPVEVPTPSEKALRYYEGNMRLWAFHVAWSILVPAAIFFGGLSARIRELARRIGRGWLPTVAAYLVLYLALTAVLDLPFDYYAGFVRQHAYGMSNQTFGKWLADLLLAQGVDILGAVLFGWVPFLLLARSPRRWWLYTAILSVPFLFLVVLIKPIWIDPLFNTFGPMKDPALERSILDLASRAGIEGSRVFEVAKRVDTNAMNAYVTGLGGTKRIVLWDTLIDGMNERELLAVMGHEMGHYVLGHVLKSILLSSLVTLLGLFLIDRVGCWVVTRSANRTGVESLADVASAPLLAMLLVLNSLLLGPIVMAYSRHQEHEADRFSLDLTHANHSTGMAFVKLQRENLSNPRPGPIYTIFRGSHPSLGDRIDFANSYHPWADE